MKNYPSEKKVHRVLIHFILLSFIFLGSAIVHTKEILKSPNDQRHYASMILKNGLRVILVSDPDTDKAAASLDVNIGYFQDPNDRAGLAHFLEHMLFLGTEKYPDANSYKEFISNHSGRDNAYTSSDHTNYFFDIDKHFLDEALDRFAQFFIAPLFNEKFVQREMKAVNSEYRLKIKDDNRRSYQVLKATANPRHPLSKFSVGNLDSLSDRKESKTRDDLIFFYNKYYSANLMTLAVIGKEPLNELKKMVRRFSAIKNLNTVIAAIDTPLFTPQQNQVRINIIPLKETRSLTLSFTIPWYERYYQEKPFMLLSHLLGHEGSNSLHSLLKKRGWINSLSAGIGLFTNNYITFDITTDLTKAGLEHIDEITMLTFQTIALIRQAGVKEWIHKETKKISDLNFRFKEKSDPKSEVLSLASNLHDYPAYLVVKGPYTSNAFSAQNIINIIENLNSKNLRQIIIAPGLSTDKIEVYYNTHYSIKPLATEQVNKWQQASINPLISIPAANPFIAEQTDVLTLPSKQSIPQLIIEKNGVEVWHKQDDEFHIPKADISVSLSTTHASDTLKQSLLTTLYIALAHDSLNEFIYPAIMAGLHYSAGKGERGIGFSVGGYDDKQKEFLLHIIDTLMTLEIDPQRFEIIKKRMIRGWSNSHLDKPYLQLNRSLGTLLKPRRWTADAYLKIIDDISVAGLKSHIKRLLQQAHIKMFIHGNITEDKAVQLANNIISRLHKELTPAAALKRHAIKINSLSKPQRFSLDIDHNDSAVISYYQSDSDSTRTQALNLLLVQILETPFFNQLRTSEQLGYIVHAGLSYSLRLPGIKFIIQSPERNPQYLLERIENFIHQQYGVMNDMSADEYAKHQQAVLTSLLEKDKRMSQRTQRYHRALKLKYMNFNHREELAEAIRSTSVNDISHYYQALLLADKKRQLIIESTGNNHHPDKKPTNIKKLSMDIIESFRSVQTDFSL